MPALTAMCVPPAQQWPGSTLSPGTAESPQQGRTCHKDALSPLKLVGDTSTNLLGPYSSSTRGPPPRSPSLIAPLTPGREQTSALVPPVQLEPLIKPPAPSGTGVSRRLSLHVPAAAPGTGSVGRHAVPAGGTTAPHVWLVHLCIPCAGGRSYTKVQISPLTCREIKGQWDLISCRGTGGFNPLLSLWLGVPARSYPGVFRFPTQGSVPEEEMMLCPPPRTPLGLCLW